MCLTIGLMLSNVYIDVMIINFFLVLWLLFITIKSITNLSGLTIRLSANQPYASLELMGNNLGPFDTLQIELDNSTNMTESDFVFRIEPSFCLHNHRCELSIYLNENYRLYYEIGNVTIDSTDCVGELIATQYTFVYKCVSREALRLNPKRGYFLVSMEVDNAVVNYNLTGKVGRPKCSSVRPRNIFVLEEVTLITIKGDYLDHLANPVFRLLLGNQVELPLVECLMANVIKIRCKLNTTRTIAMVEDAYLLANSHGFDLDDFCDDLLRLIPNTNFGELKYDPNKRLLYFKASGFIETEIVRIKILFSRLPKNQAIDCKFVPKLKTKNYFLCEVMNHSITITANDKPYVQFIIRQRVFTIDQIEFISGSVESMNFGKIIVLILGILSSIAFAMGIFFIQRRLKVRIEEDPFYSLSTSKSYKSKTKSRSITKSATKSTPSGSGYSTEASPTPSNAQLDSIRMKFNSMKRDQLDTSIATLPSPKSDVINKSLPTNESGTSET